MAKKDKGPISCNYSQEIKLLKNFELKSIYCLYGPETYLRDNYFNTLFSICLPEGDMGFSYKRFDGPEIDSASFSEAVDQLPFMTDRSFIEIRDADLNNLDNADDIIGILKNVPEYCIICFVNSAEFVPDARLKINKFLKSSACSLYFGKQDLKLLCEWIQKRFSSLDKTIRPETAERLVMISGGLMNSLIPEIDKIAAYSSGSEITKNDVNLIATHIPESDVFDMVNSISSKNYDSALNTLSELLQNKDTSPIAVLALISSNFRKLYGTKIAIECKRSKDEISEIINSNNNYYLDQTIQAAKRFSLDTLKEAVRTCAEYEYKIKSSYTDEKDALISAVTLIIAGDRIEQKLRYGQR